MVEQKERHLVAFFTVLPAYYRFTDLSKNYQIKISEPQVQTFPLRNSNGHISTLLKGYCMKTANNDMETMQLVLDIQLVTYYIKLI